MYKTKDCKVTKSMSEKYTLKFNNGDYANIVIDDSGMLSCESTLGNYGYHWGSFGDCFKKFLISLDSGYLYNKLCDANYFDCNDYRHDCKKEIFKLRKSGDIGKETARELYDYFEKDFYAESYDVACEEVYRSEVLNDFCDEIIYSEFFPEKRYSPDQKYFIEVVYPEFVKILKNELHSKDYKIGKAV